MFVVEKKIAFFACREYILKTKMLLNARQSEGKTSPENSVGPQGERQEKNQTLESAPGSQSHTMNLPSQFTSHFPLFSLGQSF